MAVCMPDVRFYPLYIFVSMYENGFKLHQVKPPLPCLKATADDCFFKLVVIAGYSKPLLKRRLHLVVVVGIGIKTSQSELDSFWGNVHLAHNGCIVRIETAVRIVHVQIFRRILFDDNIDRTTYGRTSELGRDNSFVYLDAVDHFDRNIIDVDKIGIVVHRIPVNEKPDAFAFQSAHRYARGTARSTRGTHGDSGSFCQNVLYIVNRSLYLVHADNGYGHGLLP